MKEQREGGRGGMWDRSWVELVRLLARLLVDNA